MRPLIIFALTLLVASCFAQQETTLIHGCESLDGVTVSVGDKREGTLLVIARAAEYVTEGAGSIRIASHSPADAEGNTYVAVDLQIAPTDFTNCALVFDAASSLPEQTKALYVRGYDEAGNCVLSWQCWKSPLTAQMQTFRLYPGRDSGDIKWEPDEIEAEDRSVVVRLRFFAGTSLKDADFNLFIDNIRTVAGGPVLHSCDDTEGMTIDLGRDWPGTVLESNTDPRYVTEGTASVHLAGTSPAEATGNSYLCVGIPIPSTDFTAGTTLKIDAATSTPAQSKALYVRGYNADGECVLSWTSWGGLLTDGMQTFELYPGMSYADMVWEADAVEGREPVGVVKLRIYTGTNEAGQPFDIYIDNIRTGRSTLQSFQDVTEPKPRYPETTLVENGQPQAIIVTPRGDDWQAVAEEVAALITEATGVTLPIVNPDEVDDAKLAETNAIIIGSILNNMALLYPYSHQLTFVDGVYPGAGGYEVRTVNDPWGTGRNIIAIGASDLEGARAGVQALAPYIEAGETLVLPQILEVKLTGPAEEAYGYLFTQELDEDWANDLKQSCETHLRRAGTRGLFAYAEKQGLYYALTGREEYARMYVWMIKRTYENYLSKPDTYGGPWGMDSDFHIYTNIPAWDNVEECPALTDEERMEVTRILFQWVSELGPRKSARPGSKRVRFNHQTFPALGCLYAGQYFSRYYHAIEGEEWIRIADGTFQFQLDASKPHCDCNTYQWLTLHHTMTYCLARPDLRYFENGNARKNADYAILTMNNLGYQVPYGDIGGWGPIGRELNILRIAEWYYREGRAQWAINHKMQVRPQVALSSYSMPPDEPAVEPTDLLGTRGWPLDDLWYDSFGGAEVVERAKAVDKISFRSSFDPEAAYLLLDGLSVGGHGHMDGNSILQWTQNNRVWLADADYIKSLPKYHNGVLILRDGQSEPIPGYVELENLADLDTLGASQTVTRDYAGVDWHRNVMWLKDNLFVVADRMVAREAGDYSFRAVWQTVGDTQLDGSTLRVEQAGQHAAIIMTADTRCILNEDEYTGRNWRTYPYIDEPVVKSMQGIIDARLEPGEQVVLFTVLHASGEAPSQVQVRRIRDNAIAILGAGDPILVAVRDEQGRMVLPGAASGVGEMAVMTPTHVCGIGMTEVSALGETRTLEGGADIEVDLNTGQATLHMPAGTTVATQQMTETIALGQGAPPAEVVGLMQAVIAGAPAVVPAAQVGADLPVLAELWRFIDRPANFLLTGNAGAPEAVEAVESVEVTPEPLEANVFSGEPGQNIIENAFDGAEESTADCVMWGDDQEVTLNLRLHDSYHLEHMRLAAWFATSSSKGKLFQIGRIRLLGSNDGFQADERVLVDFTDEEMHGNWGAPGHAPEEYEFDLDADARDLRLVLTPRPGTAVYIAELELWGSGEGLEDLLIASGGGPAYLFNSVHCADLDGDGVDEVIAGSSNGKVYCLGADGRVRWVEDCDAEVNSVTTVDFAGTGRPAVVAGAMDGLVIAISPDGERMWTYQVPYYKRTPNVRTVFPADLMGDGHEVVIAGADSWRYYAIDASGDELWHYESVHGSTAGTAADLDGDGRDEVIAGTEYYWWHVISPDGSQRFGVRTAGGPCANAVAAGNIDGDGRGEAIFGGADATVQVYDADGQRLWVFNTGDEVTVVVCVDVDGDGADEILVSSLSFNVYCLDGDGTALWRTALPNQVRALAVLAGEPMQLAAGCDDGAVYTLNAADGKLLGRFETGGRIIDLAPTRAGEIIALSEDGFIYAVKATP